MERTWRYLFQKIDTIVDMRAFPLDCLRIILCLLVIDYHYGKLFSAGAMAVIGFFVLSGYFLEREFEKSANFEFEAFYKKKSIHLLPEYLFTSIIGVIITACFPSIYAVDFSQADGRPFILISLLEIANNPSWFLTCLFFFIAIAPILFCFHRTTWGIPVAFVLSWGYGLLLHEFYVGSPWLYTGIQVNTTFFLGGMLARQVYNKITVRPAVRIALAGLSALGLLAYIFTSKTGGLPELLSYSKYKACLLFMILIPMLHCSSNYSSRFHGMVFWFSSLTYAMYLFHAPVKRISICILTRLTEYTEQQILTPWAYAIFLLLTVVAAAVFYHFKQRIIKRLGNK